MWRTEGLLRHVALTGPAGDPIDELTPLRGDGDQLSFGRGEDELTDAYDVEPVEV